MRGLLSFAPSMLLLELSLGGFLLFMVRPTPATRCKYGRCACRVLRREFVDAQGLLPEQSECVALFMMHHGSRFFLQHNKIIINTRIIKI